MATFAFIVNGVEHHCDVDKDKPLLWVLREDLKLTGTKYGCGIAMCGACTTLIGGKQDHDSQTMNPVRSCALRAEEAQARPIITIEGLSHDSRHPVQLAWIEEDVPQCGYCQSGQIMTTVALLETLQRDGRPLDDDGIDAALAGNLCRCGTYQRIRKAVKSAARKMGVIVRDQP